MDQFQLSADEREHRDLALSIARDLADYFVLRIDGVIAEKGADHWQASRPRQLVSLQPSALSHFLAASVRQGKRPRIAVKCFVADPFCTSRWRIQT